MPRAPRKIEVIAYQATNTVNGHRYIGITRFGLANRERQHRRGADRGEGFHFHAAIRKYGHYAFVFEQLYDFDGDDELAEIYEIEAIAKYRPEYNLTTGGDGKAGPLTPEQLARFRAKRAGVPSYRKGVPLSEEHKARISASNKGQVPWSKGKKMPEAQKAILRAANLGNKHALGRIMSAEARKKIGDAHRGRVHLERRGVPRSEETKAKISAANKGQTAGNLGRVVTDATKQKLRAQRLGVKLPITPAREAALIVSIRKAQAANKKPVQCLNDGLVFPSAVDAAAHYGVKAQLLRQCIRRGQTMRNGLKFIEVVT